MPAANNTAATNSPFTPLRNRTCDKKVSLIPSTASSRRTHTRIPQANTLTHSKSSQASPTRQRLVHKPPALSPSKLFFNDSTPRTSNSYRKHRYGQDASPSVSSAPSLQNRRRRSAIPDTQQYVGLGGDGSQPVVKPLPDDLARPVSRRRLSNKISEIYSTKNLEKRQKEMQEAVADQESNLAPTMALGEPAKQETVTTKPVRLSIRERKNSKVAAMRKIFDRNFASKSSSSDGAQAPQQPAIEDFSPQHEEQSSKTHPTSVRSSKCTIEPPTTPRIGQEPAASNVGDAPKMARTWPSHPRSPTKKPSPPKSRAITDKLNIFEKVEGDADNAGPPIQRKRTIFRRKLSKSLRSLFEPPSRKSQEEASVVETSVPVGRPANRATVMSPDGNDVIGKKSTNVGRWNIVPSMPLSSGGDGTTSERHSLSRVNEEVVEMVIKGVECDLEEPRPVRAKDMKRMALLCRDRVSDMLEKGEVGHTTRRRFG